MLITKQKKNGMIRSSRVTLRDFWVAIAVKKSAQVSVKYLIKL